MNNSLIFVIIICLIASCSQSKSTNNKVVNIVDVVNVDKIVNETESVENLSFDNFLTLDLNNQELTSSLNNLSSLIRDNKKIFILDGKEVASLSNDSFGINLNLYFSSNSIVQLTLAGSYIGSVTIYSSEKMNLVLSSLNIESLDGPAINIQTKKKTFVTLINSNILKDSNTYTQRFLSNNSEMDLKGTFFSEGALIFNGSGSLNVLSKKKHGLVSDQHLIVKAGTITASSNKKDAIRAATAFVQQGGNIVANTSLGAGKGIKVEGQEDKNYANCYVKIDQGQLTINSHDKGITASWKIEDAKTVEIVDDPVPYVVINNGTINITTTGTPVEDGADKISPEGIESKGNLTINGGNITINSTDDAINSIGNLYINDGSIFAKSSYNDGIDTNKNFYMSGGVVVTQGTGFPESGIDSDEGVFSNTGGILVATGGRNSTPDDTVSSINAVLLNNQNVHLIMIKDNSDNLVFAYNNSEHNGSIFISTPFFLDQTQYNLYYDGTINSYNSNFHGLYLENLSGSSGNFVRSFETTGRLSNLHF